MKVLENNLGKVRCPNCDSVMIPDAADIKYRFSKPTIKCPVCGEIIWIGLGQGFMGGCCCDPFGFEKDFDDIDPSYHFRNPVLEHILKNGEKTQQKQEDQNSSDEPKFKVGDWIVSDSFKPDRANSLMKITKIDKPYYRCSSWKTILLNHLAYYVNVIEDDYHLWSIKDAKPGDLLYYPGVNTFFIIFEKLIDDTKYQAFATINLPNVSKCSNVSKCKQIYAINTAVKPVDQSQYRILINKLKKNNLWKELSECEIVKNSRYNSK